MARTRGDKEDADKYSGLLKLVQILSFLVVFVAGIIIGLATSAHINTYFTSQAQLFTASTTTSFQLSSIRDNCSSSSSSSSETVTRTRKRTTPCPNLEYCLSMDAYLHPTDLTLTHELSDDELFWRASMTPYKKEYPFLRVPKVAFMFLTRGDLPFIPLWERFFKDHEKYFSIYLHTHPDFYLNVSSDSPFFARQIPSERVEWGSVLLADAERRLLANALLDFSNERFVLLSESCIPVYNFPTVYRYLIGSSYSFVESYDDPTRYGRGRYNRKMLPNIKLYQWRKGSQWFEMQRSVATYIVSDTKYYDLFKKYCKPACYPDEHYIPTFLNMFHGSMNANRTVTWVDWSMGGPHPAMYEGVNVTEGFIQAIRNNGTLCLYNEEQTSVCYLFARKFAPSALEPLLNLSLTVMNF